MAKKKDIRLEWDMKDLLEGLDEYDAWIEEQFNQAARLVGMDGLGRMVEAAAVATGYMRGSASVHINDNFLADGRALAKTDKGNPVTGKISSGRDPHSETLILFGFNASYAAKRHENPKPAPKGGGGKFIESVLKERAKKWLEFFADSLKQT